MSDRVDDSWTSRESNVVTLNIVRKCLLRGKRQCKDREHTGVFFAIVRRLHVRSYDIYTIIDRFGELVCRQGCGSNRVKNENYIVARSRCLSAVPHHWYHSW